MSAKGSITKSDYIKWTDIEKMVADLEEAGNIKMLMMVSLGAYLGLRISDILKLTWENLQKDRFSIVEKKTKKTRELLVPKNLRLIIDRNKGKNKGLIFVNRRGEPFSSQYANASLKRLADRYNIDRRISTHSLRKSYGRRIWDMNNRSESALIMLSDIFGHSSVRVTRIYLGITGEEKEEIIMNI